MVSSITEGKPPSLAVLEKLDGGFNCIESNTETINARFREQNHSIESYKSSCELLQQKLNTTNTLYNKLLENIPNTSNQLEELNTTIGKQQEALTTLLDKITTRETPAETRAQTYIQATQHNKPPAVDGFQKTKIE